MTGRSGVLLVNPMSGSERQTPEDVAAALPGLELRASEPSELRRQLVAAVADGADVVAVAGGDGTLRSAASVLRGTESALLPVPQGTFNHFARSIGIQTLDDAAAALEHGERVRIDVGDINGECFLNNASIGWYSEMLETRGRLGRRLPRQLAKVAALLVHLPRAPRFDVELAGTMYRTWLVWVGNGHFDLRPGHLAERLSIDEHCLDVRILSADRRFARARAAIALLGRDIESSDVLQRYTLAEATFRVARSAVTAGVDGDPVGLAPPLHFSVVPQSLAVIAREV